MTGKQSIETLRGDQMAHAQRHDVFVDGRGMEDDLSTIASDCHSQKISIFVVNMPTVNDRLPATLREELRRCVSLMSNGKRACCSSCFRSIPVAAVDNGCISIEAGLLVPPWPQVGNDN